MEALRASGQTKVGQERASEKRNPHEYWTFAPQQQGLQNLYGPVRSEWNCLTEAALF